MTSECSRDIGWCWVIQVYSTLPKKKQMWLQLCQLLHLRGKTHLLLTFLACSKQNRCFIFLLSLFCSHLCSGKCLHLSHIWLTFWATPGSVCIYTSAWKSCFLTVGSGQAITVLFLWRSVWVFPCNLQSINNTHMGEREKGQQEVVLLLLSFPPLQRSV